MKISLTYETQVTVIVNLDTETVETITVRKEIGGPLTGIDGAIHVNPIHLPSDDEPFTRDHGKRAMNILKTKRHPKWVLRADGESL